MDAMESLRSLMAWEDNSETANFAMLGISVALVLFAGCMSGLTLGLCSLDKCEADAGESDRRS